MRHAGVTRSSAAHTLTLSLPLTGCRRRIIYFAPSTSRAPAHDPFSLVFRRAFSAESWNCCSRLRSLDLHHAHTHTQHNTHYARPQPLHVYKNHPAREGHATFSSHFSVPFACVSRCETRRCDGCAGRRPGLGDRAVLARRECMGGKRQDARQCSSSHGAAILAESVRAVHGFSRRGQVEGHQYQTRTVETKQ